MTMQSILPTVFLVDDDPAVRDSIALLLETAGLSSAGYASAEDFLAALGPAPAGCLVLDMHMDGMGGLDLQAELVRRGVTLPIIFLTAHGDVPTTVQAMKSGAVDFLMKPVDGARLLERVESALVLDRQARDREAARQAANARLASLTPREMEILDLAVGGCTNKEIARHLGISFRTVETHRAHILIKTGATSLAELTHLVAASGHIAFPGQAVVSRH